MMDAARIDKAAQTKMLFRLLCDGDALVQGQTLAATVCAYL
jgi:hypothetical protein